jgi:UDP-N-acetylmuramate dehydrogenase
MKPISPTLLNHILQFLESEKIPFQRDQNLSILCSFKIGGISPLVVEPDHPENLLKAWNFFQKEGIPFKILGGGTNLLISDEPVDFITIRLGGEFKEFQEVEPESGIFQIGAAALTTPTFRKISLLGFSGMEFMSTIPGWVGGAVIQNAGCYGGELFDFIDWVEFVQDGKIQRLDRKEIQYGYRTTQFLQKKDALITQIQVRLQAGNLSEIEWSLKDKRDRRNSSQPKNKKSAGSVFKNPKGLDNHGKPLKAWSLIDQVGLRGLIQGGAQISPEHCNFIVNIGEAKAKDVAYLAALIQEKVHKELGILLEREIEYFGTI